MNTNRVQIYKYNKLFSNQLPKRLKSNKTNRNGGALPYETLDFPLYEEQANCVGFCVPKERIIAWNLALETVINEIAQCKDGPVKQMETKWLNNNGTALDKASLKQDRILMKCQHQVYHMVENSKDHAYSLHCHFTQGSVLIQGKLYKDFVHYILTDAKNLSQCSLL